MSWQRVMKERKEIQRKRTNPTELLGRVLRKTTHIRSWYAQKGYKWIDIDPYYLRWLFKNEERRELLSSPHFDNKTFFRYLDRNTSGNQSVKIYVAGWPGQGKTTCCQEVSCLTLDRELGHNVTVQEAYDSHLYHTFGLAPGAKLFEDDIIQEGNVALIDDIHFKEGEGSKKVVWRWGNLARGLRFEGKHMIFASTTALHASEINPFCKLLIAGVLKEKCETIALVYLEDELDSKIKLKIRDPKAFEEIVLEAKKEYMKQLRLAGGKQTVELNQGDLIPTKLIFTPEKIRDFIIANCGDGKLTSILPDVFEGITQNAIAKRINLSQKRVSELITNFGESRYGYIVEEFFRNKFKDRRNIIGRARQGVPDVITHDGEILSVKGHINYKKSQIIYPLEDCKPELEAGDRFKIIYVNPVWHDGYMEFEVNSKHPPNWVSFFKDGRIESG